MNGKLRKIGIGFLVTCVLLFCARNLMASIALGATIRTVTGLRVTIDQMDVGMWGGNVRIKGLRLINPPGFPDRVMIYFPELFVGCHLAEILQGKIHLRKVRLEMSEFLVERNQKGTLNLDSLKFLQSKKEKRATAAPSSKPSAGKLQIDLLELQMGRALYKDYSKTPPFIREFPLRIEQHYRQITDLQVVASLVLAQAVVNTTISRLTNFDATLLTGDVQKALRGAVSLGTGFVGTAAETTTGTAEKTLETLKKLLPSGKPKGED